MGTTYLPVLKVIMLKQSFKLSSVAVPDPLLSILPNDMGFGFEAFVEFFIILLERHERIFHWPFY